MYYLFWAGLMPLNYSWLFFLYYTFIIGINVCLYAVLYLLYLLLISSVLNGKFLLSYFTLVSFLYCSLKNLDILDYKGKKSLFYRMPKHSFCYEHAVSFLLVIWKNLLISLRQRVPDGTRPAAQDVCVCV